MTKKIRMKSKGGKKRGRGEGPQGPPIHEIELGPSKSRTPSRFVSEQMNRLISIMIEREGLDEIDEINAFIQEKIISHPLDELMAEMELGPVEKAQALAYQAMEARDISEM